MAALFWLLFVWRWFDVGTSFRPAWLEVVPPFLLAVPALLLSARFVASRRAILIEPRPELRLLVGLVTTLAVLFRLPFVAQGAAGAVTPDGALSGIVMLRVLRGAEHLVFVPHVPYSGSLKSHLAAVFAVFMDPACAFALVSVLFYALFVAGVCRLAARPRHTKAVVLAAGLYAAFAPPFVTRYSLSNDGNYVEVLGLGTWALVLAVRWVEGPGSARRTVAFVAGILLGLAFWCHILAVIPLAAISVFFLVFDWRAALRSFPALAAGWALGDAPGLLWNLAHRGESFFYLLPGGPKVGGEAAGPGFAAHLAFLVTDHLPVLFGSDTGYGVAIDRALYSFGWFGLVLVAVAAWRAAGPAWRERDPALLALLVFAAVNVVVALLALPYLPGNARYVLFLTAPAAVLLARSFAPSRCRSQRPRRARRGGCPRLPGPAPRHRASRHALARLRLGPRGGERAALLQRLLPGHEDQLPLGGAHRVRSQAGSHHDRVLLRLPKHRGGGARSRARRRERHGRAQARGAARGAGRGL